jgi:hypothetical protein
MICSICGKETEEVRATLEYPYLYSISGLNGIRLCGIRVRRCIACGEESPIIPRIEELHGLIADILIQKPGLLEGSELRYLRKHAEFSSVHFSALLDVAPSHLSRFENGKIGTLSAAVDKLARAVYLAAGNCETIRDILLREADRRIAVKDTAKMFMLTGNHWGVAA